MPACVCAASQALDPKARPGADDAAKLSRAFRGESVSPLVSRTGQFEGKSEQLSDTEVPGPSR